MASKTFDKDDLDAMLWGDHETLKLVSKKITDQGRWRTYFDVVFKDGDKFYRTSYEKGSTENCEGEGFAGNEDCVEVRPVEKTITVYEPVTDG